MSEVINEALRDMEGLIIIIRSAVSVTEFNQKDLDIKEKKKAMDVKTLALLNNPAHSCLSPTYLSTSSHQPLPPRRSPWGS